MKMEPGTHALHTYWNSEDHLPSHWGTDSGLHGLLYSRGLQTFLSEGHISYYTTVRGPEILRTVIVS